jgi:hypothetical protein
MLHPKTLYTPIILQQKIKPPPKSAWYPYALLFPP